MFLAALGNESIGLSTGQIKTINPANLYRALSTFSTVSGWDYGQASAIIQALMTSGLVQVAAACHCLFHWIQIWCESEFVNMSYPNAASQINSSSSLFMLGSLVVGVPAAVFNRISGSQLITAATNPSFLANLMSGPQIIQEAFVTQVWLLHVCYRVCRMHECRAPF